MITFTLNGRTVTVRSPEDSPLLWVIRDELGLTGTKFGCGIGQCGACTVHLDGRATRSCITPLAAVAGAKVTTIEGLDGGEQAPPAERLARASGPSVRLLPAGADHAGLHVAQGLSRADGPRHRRGDEREPVPLHGVPANPSGDQARRQPRPGGDQPWLASANAARRAASSSSRWRVPWRCSGTPRPFSRALRQLALAGSSSRPSGTGSIRRAR